MDRAPTPGPVHPEVPADWEVVVADNGSDDGTRACVQRWSERHPRIHLVDASARRGAAAARNIGVRSARGRLLAFCDADDVEAAGGIDIGDRAAAGADRNQVDHRHQDRMAADIRSCAHS